MAPVKWIDGLVQLTGIPYFVTQLISSLALHLTILLHKPSMNINDVIGTIRTEIGYASSFDKQNKENVEAVYSTSLDLTACLPHETRS